MATATRAETQTQTAIRSILAADFGSVNTRAVLFDLVDGQFRLVSRGQSLTTAAPPVGDVEVGLRRALEQMGGLIGRTLVGQDGVIVGERADGSGVDRFLATASGGKPMRTVLVGMMPDVSLRSAQRALGSTYIDVAETLSLTEGRTTEQQVNAILRAEPDLIFIVGGTDGGAREPMLALLRTVRLAVLLGGMAKPAVLYAGNAALKRDVEELIGSETQVFMAENVRPALLQEELDQAQLELALTFGAYKAARKGGYDAIQKASSLGILPTAQGYFAALRYLGTLAAKGQGVLCVDVGSSTVTICASLNKKPYINIRPDLGLGHSAVVGLKAVGTKAVQRWLTFKASDAEVLDYAWNKTLRPSTVPQISQDLELEYAITRELIRTAVAEARLAWRGVPAQGELLPPMRPIIGGGAVLASALNPGITALILLDALQPVGLTDLQIDPYGALPALGTIGFVEPLATVQALETSGLTRLGTAVCPSGQPRGSNAIYVTVRYEGGQVLERTVPSGMVKSIFLPAGQKAQVTVRLGGGLSLNGKRRLNFSAEGGAAGLVLDARGRPLLVPRDPARRAEVLPRWYSAVRTPDSD